MRGVVVDPVSVPIRHRAQLFDDDPGALSAADDGSCLGNVAFADFFREDDLIAQAPRGLSVLKMLLPQQPGWPAAG